MTDRLSHIDETGQAKMVNVGDKPATARRAIAIATVHASAELVAAIRNNDLAKGNLIEVARLAGIQAAKRTDQLIPLCHALPLEHADVQIEIHDDHLAIRATCATTAKTGVEMEALTAAAVAALTVIDMGKAIDKTMVIDDLRLIEKTGGRSGHFQAPTRPHHR